MMDLIKKLIYTLSYKADVTVPFFLSII